ncbi:MAG: hypothetical protein WCY05_05385 [Candidatus Omnitrophota bacterium]
MYKRIFFVSYFLFLLFFPSLLFAQSPDKEMTLTLVIPQAHNFSERQIYKRFDNKPNFHVLLKNISNKSERIWQEICSSGYENLYFELEVNGKKILIQKSPKDWSKNYPDYLTINPGEYIVFDVYITTDEWGGLPKVTEKTPVKIKAIYETKEIPLKNSKSYNVWSGKIESQTLDVSIYP